MDMPWILPRRCDVFYAILKPIHPVNMSIFRRQARGATGHLFSESNVIANSDVE
jgi:hypothetical protein